MFVSNITHGLRDRSSIKVSVTSEKGTVYISVHIFVQHWQFCSTRDNSAMQLGHFDGVGSFILGQTQPLAIEFRD
jgi:hypothetical protein